MSNESTTFTGEGSIEPATECATAQARPNRFSQAAPDAPPPPTSNEKARRVGTITMGLALVVSGLCALLAMFLPTFPIFMVLKLSPLVLVLLGLEIIINSFAFRGHRLKYDLLSMFVCFLLIVGSVGASALPQVYRNWGPQRADMQRNVEHSIEALCAEHLASVPDVLEASSNVHFLRDMIDYVENADTTVLTASDHVRINLQMGGPYADTTAFSAACRTTLDALQTMPVRMDSVNFVYRSDDKTNFELLIDSPLAWKHDVATLSKLVSSEESERRKLEKERDDLYAQIEIERAALNKERAEMYAQTESERAALNNERAEMYAQTESERTSLDNERAEMYAQIENERAAS